MTKRILILTFLMITILHSQQYEPNWESLDSRPVAPWFEDAKFGIFIHWGPYSVPAWSPKGTYSEWYQYWLQTKTLFGNGQFTGTEVYDFHVKTYGEDFTYYQFGEMFTNDLFEPDDWVRLFEQSGAKYVVTTTKHHDGYCMWPSREANDRGFPWNSMKVGAKRDIVGELTAAMRKTNLKLGFYYSLYEWFHPWWLNDKERFVDEHFHPQFKDLVERYQPDILWGDGEWDLPAEEWKTPELLAWLFNESSVKDNVVINDRWGAGIRKKHGGYFTTEYESSAEFDKPWEECRGMGFSFGYNRNEDAEDYNAAQTLILMLVDIVSNGGNLLLDIGPDHRGRIPVIMQERLLQMGRWLRVNGEAIYGTRRWRQPFQWSDGKQDYKPEGQHYLGGDYILKLTVDPEPGYAVKQVYFTYKKGNLYAICPRWPGKELVIENFNAEKGTEVYFPAYDRQLNWENRGSDLVIETPVFDPNILKGDLSHTYVFRISNVKGFVRNPSIDIDYKELGKKPLVTLSCPTAGSVIRYTIDGSEPTASSSKYEKPFSLSESGTIMARAFADGKTPSNVEMQVVTLIDKYKSITLVNEPNIRYAANGAVTLADEVRGSKDYGNGQWLGFEGDDFEAIVDLGKKQVVSTISAGFLSDQNGWIFWPGKVEFAVSHDGKSYKTVASEEITVTKKTEEKAIKNVSAALFDGLGIRYVRIKALNVGTCPEWHKGAGGKAWLFVDEVEVE